MTREEYDAEWMRHYRAYRNAYDAWQSAPAGHGGAAIRELERVDRARNEFMAAAVIECRYACAAFPMCGCNVEALSPPSSD